MSYDHLPEPYSIDPYSGKKLLLDFSQELTIESFLNQLNIKDFYKICDCKLKDPKRYKKARSIPFDYIPLDNLKDKYKNRGEVVYIMGIVDDILQAQAQANVGKIGVTTDGMKKRHTSYNAGSRKTRKEGTPSTTNFHITEAIYATLREGKKVEWWAYDVPPEEITADCFGTGIMKTMKASYGSPLESSLIAEYEKLTGHRPLLSTNG